MDPRLEQTLSRWHARLRATESLAWSAWALTAGLALALATALAARAVPMLTSAALARLSATLILGAALLGLAAAWTPWRSQSRLVRLFDRRLGLSERLTTALELGSGRLRTSPAMAAAQQADTLATAAAVDVRASLPLQVPRRALLASGLLAVALIAALVVPNPQEALLQRRAALEAALAEQADRLQSVHDQIAQAEGLSDAEREELLRALEAAIAALEAERATPEEGVAALAEAERQLAELRDPGAPALQQGLESAAEQMVDSPLTEAIAEALSRGDTAEAAQALAAMAERESLTLEEALQLAAELAQAAEALAQGDPQLAQQLADAAAEIGEEGIEQARDAIRRAAEGMAQAGERVRGQQALEEALAALQGARDEIAAQTSDGGGSAGSGQPAAGQAPAGGQQAQPGHHEDTGSAAPYDEVAVPSRLEGEGEAVDLGREDDAAAPVGGAPLPAPTGSQATVPYREVYTEYAEQAVAALEGSYIPLALKQYVRDYFSSLEP